MNRGSREHIPARGIVICAIIRPFGVNDTR